MSKKKTGLLIAIGAVIGAAAACVSYYLKYKAFSDDIDQDFHDYEDDESFTPEPVKNHTSSAEDPDRTYISLDQHRYKDYDEEEPHIHPHEENAYEQAYEEPDELEVTAHPEPEEDPDEQPVDEANVVVEEDKDEEKA